MRELNLFRRTLRREARHLTGRHPDFPTLLSAQSQAGGFEAALVVLPEDTSDLTPIQAPDGTFYFTVGFDRVGDPNHPIAPG